MDGGKGNLLVLWFLLWLALFRMIRKLLRTIPSIRLKHSSF